MQERIRLNINRTEFSSSADDEVLILEIVEKFEEMRIEKTIVYLLAAEGYELPTDTPAE